MTAEHNKRLWCQKAVFHVGNLKRTAAPGRKRALRPFSWALCVSNRRALKKADDDQGSN